MNISVLGVDIAKNIFQLHGVDSSGNRVLKQRIEREKLSSYIANLPVCTIVMESCGGANYWARVFQRQGHAVKLISPQFVKPFVKTNKNDANDAQAIVEAASRPSMHCKEIKIRAKFAEQLANLYFPGGLLNVPHGNNGRCGIPEEVVEMMTAIYTMNKETKIIELNLKLAAKENSSALQKLIEENKILKEENAHLHHKLSSSKIDPQEKEVPFSPVPKMLNFF